METELKPVVIEGFHSVGLLQPTKWDYRFMKMADLQVAQWSKDSTKVGCVLVNGNDIVSTGYNAIPEAINDDIKERNERPEKYHWYVHAEINAIISAARQGKSTMGCYAYLNWYPCDKCAAALVNAGIIRVYCDKAPDWSDKTWGEGFNRTRTIFHEAAVDVVYMNCTVNRKGIDESR